jgi:hypothetical protein
LLAFQLWISTEFWATSTIVLALGFVLAFSLDPTVRARLRSALAPVAAGYVLGLVLAAPFVVYMLIGLPSRSVVSDVRYSGTDLLDFAVPNGVIAIGGASFDSSLWNHVRSGYSAYLGLPALLMIAAFALRERRSPGARFLVAGLVATAVIALGVTLQVGGHELIELPWWNAATHLPAIQNALPFRFAVFTSLAAAVIVALWTARTKGRVFPRPYVLPALAVVALVPAVWQTSVPTFRPTHPERWAFFTGGLYKSCIPHNETVAIFPFPKAEFLQAESGFRFRAAANGLRSFPKYGVPLTSFDADRVVWELTFIDYARPSMDQLLAFAAIHHVGRIISIPKYGYPSRRQLRSFGPVQLTGGVLVSPACGQPPLTERDLSSYVTTYRQQVAHPGDIGYCVGSNFDLVPVGMYPAGGLAGAKRAIVVAGTGLTCPPAPPGYKHHGYATEEGLPAHTYPRYAP